MCLCVSGDGLRLTLKLGFDAVEVVQSQEATGRPPGPARQGQGYLVWLYGNIRLKLQQYRLFLSSS